MTYNRNKRPHKFCSCVLDEDGRFAGFVTHEDKMALQRKIKMENLNVFGNVFDANYPNLKLKRCKLWATDMF